MDNWNGTKIEVSRSKGGVLAVVNPFENLISTGIVPWPASEVVQKLYKSRQERAFEEVERRRVSGVLGFYCDLQSLRSEDAITWSVFGTAARSSPAGRAKYLAELLELLGLEKTVGERSELFLWRRIPHPDNFVPGGPEIDFGIITDSIVILGEAKWMSKVGEGQGKEKGKDQIQLRREWLAKLGPRIFGRDRKFAVVGISLLNEMKKVPSSELGIQVVTTTWEKVCSLSTHPLADEVNRYYRWKLQNS